MMKVRTINFQVMRDELPSEVMNTSRSFLGSLQGQVRVCEGENQITDMSDKEHDIARIDGSLYDVDVVDD